MTKSRLQKVKLNLESQQWQRLREIARTQERSASGLVRLFVREALLRMANDQQPGRSRPAA
jgi:predicted DNA-binding ribbon-helix-helix protein